MTARLDLDAVRRQFPALSRTVAGHPAVFLDGAAGSQVPARVADAVSGYLTETNANHGGPFATSVESDAVLQAAHQAAAGRAGHLVGFAVRIVTVDEIIGVVVTLVSIDTVCRGLGEPLHPLPRPVAGEPSGYRPAQARLEEAWVPMIPGGGAVGREADLWRLRRTGNVIRAMSLVPDAVRQLMELSDVHYLPPDRIVDLRAGRAIDRAQIELVAGRVSALNECFY